MQVDPFQHVAPPVRGGVISIGNFDGVHRGHCRLLARLRDRARTRRLPAVAVSFDPHPIKLLRPEVAPPSLVWPERKEDLLRACGADDVVLMTTTRDFLSLSAEEFFDQIVRARLDAKGMVEGSNFCYGRARSGTIDVLRGQCTSAQIGLDVIDLVTGPSETEISSSQVRRELSAGKVESAAEILGRPHRIRGKVVAGDQRGRQINFPTANLSEIPVMLPKEGVYACHAWVKGNRFSAAVNVGSNPTFLIDEKKVEAYLLDFSGDLYGEVMDLDFLAQIRDVRRFDSVDDLKSQLTLDIEQTRTTAKTYTPPCGSDLGLTMREWLDLEWGPTITPVGGSMKLVRFHAGLLELSLDLPGAQTPHLLLDSPARLEQRLKMVFPEIEQIAWR